MSLLFTTFQQKSVTLLNRVVMSPMCTYSAGDDGKATNWHFVHYGTRAVGGTGLILLEATAVESRGRISNKDLGLWEDEQIPSIRNLVDFIHQQGACVGVQLAHAGRKAGVQEAIVGPSPIPFSSTSSLPLALTEEEIKQVVSSWQEGARRAKEAGFDVLEIHGAHGYLIHEFLSPISNHRTDEYGGNSEKRFRFLKEVIQAVKKEWPVNRPLYLRISAVDYVEGGLTLEDSVAIARMAKEEGVDFIDCSSGAILPVGPPSLFPGYQVPFAKEIRQKVGIATGCVGLITKPEMANEILGNGRADLIFLGRELLRNPYWALHASKARNKETYEMKIPVPYERGF